jgi:hypothetical protein
MKLIHALSLMLIAGAAHAADTQDIIKISAGTAVDCAPSPSVEQIKNDMLLRQATGNTSQNGGVNCLVVSGQPLPKSSIFFGKIEGIGKDQSGIAFQQLILPNGTLWDSHKNELSVSQGKLAGALRVTFTRDLVLGEAANVSDEVTPEQYAAGHRETLKGAKPLDKSMTLTDSKGCAWEVWEDGDTLRLTRYTMPDNTPLCADKSKAN